MDEVDFLRAAVFHGIAQNIIERVEQRLKAEGQSRDVLSRRQCRDTTPCQ
jgi:hypothetical protein